MRVARGIPTRPRHRANDGPGRTLARPLPIEERWLTYNQMVVGVLTEADVDRLFHALADATRRDIVVRAAAGDSSISSLARRYPMSVTAVQKHVAVLESAGLVRKERRGREQIVMTQQATLATVHAVLDRLEAMWRERLHRFGEVLSEQPEGEAT